MVKTILLYGAALAAFVTLLKLAEYHFMVRDLGVEVYAGLLAVMFTVFGVWAGYRLTKRKHIVNSGKPFVLSEENLSRLGISKRELEVLEMLAAGLSNQEIADRIFVSHNTVKTHLSNLFVKLDARRRTQAVQRARELSLIP